MKKLTVQNWLEVDPVVGSGIFVQLSPNGSVSSLTPADWAGYFLALELSQDVPTSIHEQFEVARGAIVYGSLFYPLFTLGLEQMFRLAETAARAKATALGLNTKKHYAEILKDLLGRGVLTQVEHDDWSKMRRLRNDTSHPAAQMILPPALFSACCKR